VKSPQHRLRREAEQARPALRRREADQRLRLDARRRMRCERAADRAGQRRHVAARRVGEDRPGDGAACPTFLETGAGDRLRIPLAIRGERGPAGAGIGHLLGPAVRAQGHAEMLLVRLECQRVQVAGLVGLNLHALHPLS
jgi:hypothetical protein